MRKIEKIKPFETIEEMRAAFPHGRIEAWGDESVRMTADPPMYLLGATVLMGDPWHLLDALEMVKPKGAQKLHWRDLGMKAQEQSLGAIVDMLQTATIVIASPLVGNKQERARRKCLQELLMILERKGVNYLYLESRNPVADKRDVDFLYYLQRSRVVGDIELRHVGGRDDIRTSIPDQILGAYVDVCIEPDRKRTWADSWEQLERKITVYDVKL